MLPDPNDTIVALSSAAGPGGRAVVRMSGQAAIQIAAKVFASRERIEPGKRRFYEGEIRLPGVAAPVSGDLYVWPAPRTYTGQNLAELHILSCPPLVELLINQLLNAGARAAQAGEFTLRAFLAGKLDLTRAEAVLAIIEAGGRDELKQALAQSAGGITRPLERLRSDLLDLLADVEAGLDFSAEDVQFIDDSELFKRLGNALAMVTLVKKQLDQRTVAERPFRVVLAGRPNAGKSSLFNALGGAAALVSSEPGTTRDYLVQRLTLNGMTVELVDTAGWKESTNGVERQAQDLAREQTEGADLVLLCLEAGRAITAAEEARLQGGQTPPVVGIATKCDLAAVPAKLLATSAVTRHGLEELKKVLAERAGIHYRPALAPSLSRCRHHVETCLRHLRTAHTLAVHQEPPELLALEIRGAIDQLGEMVGAVYTDDLLDRIFSRFCIGK